MKLIKREGESQRDASYESHSREEKLQNVVGSRKSKAEIDNERLPDHYTKKDTSAEDVESEPVTSLLETELETAQPVVNDTTVSESAAEKDTPIKPLNHVKYEANPTLEELTDIPETPIVQDQPLVHSMVLGTEAEHDDVETYAGRLLKEKLGRGGFARVYRTENGGDDTVLKIPLNNNPKAKEALRREAKIYRALDGITGVLPLKRDETRSEEPYLELALGGKTLREVYGNEDELTQKQKNKNATRRVKGWLQTLSDIHGAGILHRDIKPENLFVAEDKESNEVLYIGDLGLSQKIGEEPELTPLQASLTGSLEDIEQSIGGTIGYTSLEELLGRKQSTIKSDLHNMGVVLYESITGELPKPYSVDEKLKQAGANRIVRTVIKKAIQREYESAQNMLDELNTRSLGEIVGEKLDAARTKAAEGIAKITGSNMANVSKRAYDKTARIARKANGFWKPWYIKPSRIGSGDTLYINGILAYQGEGRVIATEKTEKGQKRVYFVDLGTGPLEQKEYTPLRVKLKALARKFPSQKEESEEARKAKIWLSEGILWRENSNGQKEKIAETGDKTEILEERVRGFNLMSRDYCSREIPVYLVRHKTKNSWETVEKWRTWSLFIDGSEMSLNITERPEISKERINLGPSRHLEEHLEDFVLTEQGDILFTKTMMDERTGYPTEREARVLNDKGVTRVGDCSLSEKKPHVYDLLLQLHRSIHTVKRGSDIISAGDTNIRRKGTQIAGSIYVNGLDVTRTESSKNYEILDQTIDDHAMFKFGNGFYIGTKKIGENINIVGKIGDTYVVSKGDECFFLGSDGLKMLPKDQQAFPIDSNENNGVLLVDFNGCKISYYDPNGNERLELVNNAVNMELISHWYGPKPLEIVAHRDGESTYFVDGQEVITGADIEPSFSLDYHKPIHFRMRQGKRVVKKAKEVKTHYKGTCDMNGNPKYWNDTSTFRERMTQYHFTALVGNVEVPDSDRHLVEVATLDSRKEAYRGGHSSWSDDQVDKLLPSRPAMEWVKKRNEDIATLANDILTHQEFSLPIDAYEAGMKPAPTEFYKPNHTSPTNRR